MKELGLKLGVVAMTTGVIGLLIFFPVIVFFGGWLGGVILNWIVGDTLLTGLQTILPSATADTIPAITGTLALIGSYFKVYQTGKSNK